MLGFGLALVDFDGDGRNDLIQANGHVLDRARLGIPFAMRPTLLRNTGGGVSGRRRGRRALVQAADSGPRAGGRRSGRRRPSRCRRQLPRCPRRRVAERLRRESFPGSGHHRQGRQAGRWRSRRRSRQGGTGARASSRRAEAILRRPRPDWFSGWAAQSVERIDVTWPWAGSESWSAPAVPERGRCGSARGRAGRAVTVHRVSSSKNRGD